MKILQVNCVYKTGSTGKIVYDIHSELMKQNIESIVCYGRGKKVKEKYVYKTSNEIYSKINNLLSRFTGIMYGGCYFSTKRLIQIIKKEKPDIVHLHCINGYFVNIYKLVEWLKVNKIRTVLTLHAEFMYTGGCSHSLDCNQWKEEKGCGYYKKCPRWRCETKSLFKDNTVKMWKRMRDSFDGFYNGLVITSVSPWVMNRAKNSIILKGKKHQVVLNGVDTTIFNRVIDENIKKELGLDNKSLIIFHVTPNFNLSKDHIKGGYFVNEIAKKLSDKNVKIVVAGEYQEGVDVSSNIIFLGRIIDQRLLAKLYSISDLTLMTSKRETFSMVTAESLCCGTPVVGFKAGAPEQIAIKKYSRFVDYANLESLEIEVNRMLNEKYSKDTISEEAIKLYSKNLMCEKYIDVYKKLN